MSKLRDQFDQGSVSKLTGRDFIRKATDRKYYGYTFDQAGRHPISLAIDFMTKDGDRFGVFYMEIQSPIQFQLGDGVTEQKIQIQTHSNEISIEGRKLAPIYEYLLEQRLVWLKEEDSTFEPNIEDSQVKSIVLTDQKK
jgi:hypothetical protein